MEEVSCKEKIKSVLKTAKVVFKVRMTRNKK